jgi:hypothetical protein
MAAQVNTMELLLIPVRALAMSGVGRRNGVPVWGRYLLQDVSLGHEFRLPVDVPTSLPAAASRLAGPTG